MTAGGVGVTQEQTRVHLLGTVEEGPRRSQKFRTKHPGRSDVFSASVNTFFCVLFFCWSAVRIFLFFNFSVGPHLLVDVASFSSGSFPYA